MIGRSMSSIAAPRTPLELVVPVCVAGLVAVGVAAVALGTSRLSSGELAGALALLTLAVAAERFHVPAGSTTISFVAVFAVAAAVSYGSATAAVVAGVAILGGEMGRRKPPVRVAYNASQAALAGCAAGFVAGVVGGEDRVLLASALASLTFFAVNLLLVTSAIARAERRPPLPLIKTTAAGVALPIGLALSIVPLFLVAWENSKSVAVTCVVPLAAIGLYLRSLATSKQRLELALTDPLTGLGNRRHFDERLRAELDKADAGDGELSLVLLDLDGFKSVNDTFGHEAGDRVLCDIAGTLRQGGEAFRIGGDEFALVLPGRDAEAAIEIAHAVRMRIAPWTAALGLSTYPGGGVPREELVRAADRALYDEKRSPRDLD
jgi:diguanylate cyclase (GGDEF)-like protein